ncbi:MAG: flagellar assembly peptidoglycan hydrolase FlgJ [Rhodoplanes sp.]|nr:flagellar assembly peptidoglycan hydrolase FlgJ [Rhodoplanes sp.]
MALDAARGTTRPSTGTPIGSHASTKTAAEKARAQAQDFEAMFLNTMMQSMFTGIGSEGPMGNSPSTGVWRSFMIDEYAKSFAKAGGVGLANQVYGTLLGQQEARSAAPTKTSIQ